MEGIDTIDEIETKYVKENDNESNNDSQEELKKSVINLAGLLGPTHPGRPANEEPHVKKSMKNKKEKIELICRIDQDELGFQEDDYDDLKALFELFDFDQDGVVNMKEGQAMLKCVGLSTDDENMAEMVKYVGVDTTHFSLSFNEYLNLVSMKRREEPKNASLLAAFKLFDQSNSGFLTTSMFRQILKTKHVSDADINDMLEEYKQSDKEHSEGKINYEKFIEMLSL